MGSNAHEAFKKICLFFDKGPSIFSITTSSTSEIDEFDSCNYEDLFVRNSSQELKKAIWHNTVIEERKI